MAGVIHFENPPLEEVVCGVHFEGVEWSDIHFGLFFNELDGRYQRTQRRTPVKVFDPQVQDAPQIQVVTVTELDSPLLWYESTESPFLLQVQRDAFFLNWRGQSGTFVYPHFHTREGGAEGVWDRFIREWHVFRDFCETHEIGTPEILDCHLAYIDHMVHGEAWNVPSDLVRWVHPLKGLQNLTTVSIFTMSFKYESREFPMRVNIRPAIRKSDQKQLFIMEFISTGKLPAESNLETWFDKAHATIVQEFLAQTTEEAHKKWRLSYV